MSAPHQQGKIPWHCLTDHVEFDGSTGFKIRRTSQIDERKKAFAHFARVLASLIVEGAEDQLSRLPKPNASRDAWKDVGVQDNALFPVDIMEAFSAPAYINSDDLKFLERRYWEHAHSDYDVQFVVMVLIKPTNPFRHLAPLIYLAQHPRVAMRNLIKIYTYPEQTSLRSFTYYTMMYYLLLNLVLALDSGASFDEVLARAALFHSRFRDSGPVNVSVGNEDPHTAFWYSSAPPAYQSPDLREAYNLRCFRLLVALYAFMKETTLRDIALGEDPYNSKLFSRGKTAFDKVTLVDVICRALNSIAVAFSDLDPSFATRDPPATLAHNPRASNTNHQAPGEPRRQSRLVGLPTEIHRYIYSFLPIRLQSLVDLAATCKRLRVICTPLIYVDPFPYPATSIEEICRLEARSSALATVLSLKPHLASHIRRLRVRVEGNISSHDVYTMKYPPLHLCLADSLTHLVELHLYVPSLCENCDSELEENNSLEVTCYLRTLDAIATIARRWPNLSSFSLLDLGADLSDEVSTIPSSTPAALIPRNLERLAINADQYDFIPVSWTFQKAMMSASSHTLRHLVLHHEQATTPDLLAFPTLERLELTTVSPIEDIRLLLQKSFSSVRFLSLDSTDSENDSNIPMDLSDIFDNLEHLSVASSTCSRLILPPSVVTFQLYSDIDHPPISVNGSSHLEALCCEGPSHTVFEVFPSLSALQTVRSLELKLTVKPDDLSRLGEIVAVRLPKLEVLILSVPAFNYRPRREDYPMDDGLDDVQKAAAVSFFESCPGLNTISFNGIPDVWDPIGRFPARVWTRDSGDGGAHMTGRAALPWKVGEVWQ